MLAFLMLLRVLFGLALSALALPALAQREFANEVHPAADCTVDVAMQAGPLLEVDFGCRAGPALSFQPDDRRMERHMARRVDSDNAVRYLFDLKAYAREVDSTSMAVLRGDGVLATLSSWLLEVKGFDRTPVIDIRIHATEGQSFAAGLPRVNGAWRLANAAIGMAGYTALGRFDLRELPVPAPGSLRPGLSGPAAKREEGVLRLAILDGVSPAGRADLVDWVRRTAEAEANWWQGFTARQSMVGLVPTSSRRAAGYGRTVSGGGATVMVEVGSDVDRRKLFNDWVLVHELIHTGMPYLRGRATWFMEGAATYIEPIIRARAGWKSEAEVWQEWVENMPQGVGAFANGLSTASGRQNYWAGALFMLMADLGLRRATDGAPNGSKGLEDCLAGALGQQFDATRRVLLADYAAACDRATGTTIVSGLIARHEVRQPVDLAELWRDLGIAADNGRIVLNDQAPLARWRRMIVFGPDRSKLKPVKLPWES